MTDIVDTATRSKMMAGIKSKDTRPELLVRKALWSRGFRYKLHDRTLPGKPDLVFPKYKTVIFVHGCFWHGHECKGTKIPASRREFWEAKISRNRKRDIESVMKLSIAKYRCILIWECALKRKSEMQLDQLFDEVSRFLSMQNGNYHLKVFENADNESWRLDRFILE